MLDTIESAVSKRLESSEDFSTFYNEYLMKIQDMDIDNEILPLIKRETTEYVAAQKKLERLRKRTRRKMFSDIER